MGLETGTYINSLVVTNPVGSDPKSAGDDHLRLIKSTLKNTFPNISAVVNATADQLNKLTDPGGVVPVGTIVMWGWEQSSIPTGWKICNGVGTLSNGRDIPNLLDRFVIAAGSGYAIRATGGTATHSHTASTSVSINPATDSVYVSLDGWGVSGSGMGTATGGRIITGRGTPEQSEFLESIGPATTGQTFGTNGHNHGVGASTGVNATSVLPPYYALFFIIKN